MKSYMDSWDSIRYVSDWYTNNLQKTIDINVFRYTRAYFVNLTIKVMNFEKNNDSRQKMWVHHHEQESKMQNLEWKSEMEDPTLHGKDYVNRYLGLTRPTSGGLSIKGVYNE